MSKLIKEKLDNFDADMLRVRSSSARLLIKRKAIEHNLSVIVDCSPTSKIMAVVKGNAYGAGVEEILTIIDPYTDAYACDNLSEAINLRKLGVEKKILVFEGGVRDCLDLVLHYKLTPGVCDVEQLRAYEALKPSTPMPIWLLTNVGFNRSGYLSNADFQKFVEEAGKSQFLTVEGIYAHMTNANLDEEISLRQINEFFKRTEIASTRLGKRLTTSLFASHAILRWAEAFPTDWIRPGILMYGEHIYDKTKLTEDDRQLVSKLQPALSLQARIMSLETITEDGQALGYGQRIHIAKGKRLANVGIGFGSGFPTGIQAIPALINSVSTCTLGHAGMDITQIDISRIETAAPLDWVTFFGEDGENSISLQHFLKIINQSPYEFLTNLKVSKKII